MARKTLIKKVLHELSPPTFLVVWTNSVCMKFGIISAFCPASVSIYHIVLTAFIVKPGSVITWNDVTVLAFQTTLHSYSSFITWKKYQIQTAKLRNIPTQ